ncbi:MAG: bifunctional DNA primase/polymerase [Polyangiaceae bacterium]|nr:bifunctional DNA primase/polymerase [Polyangiaceae bacterium]
MTNLSRLARAALWYSRRLGWAVFPLRPRDKTPLIPRADGGRGYLDATDDPGQIAQWWAETPDANVGVACGASGLTIVDIDPRNGGDDAWEELTRDSEIPSTVECLTGGGGRHLYFAGAGRTCALRDGVEVASHGHYVVAPPSIHPSGRQYNWEASSRPNEVELAPLPEWLCRMIGERPACRIYDPGSGTTDPQSFPLGAAFAADGLLGSELRPGVWAVLCPNRAQHTTGRDFDSSTILFAPGAGQRRGYVHCSHAHCREIY